ncbi:GntR family transcriptional regulator [Microlunatus speluncae]|uniref:GntR family transcriptional regulator n=1 Tax=Microlunatus speluncae TaxID=2594267 RepID=UPI001FE686F4|nr:GntR family transcriptional regulator [Microlunatus speluncae]
MTERDPMITIDIDPASAVPPFDQLRSQLAAMITDGRLEPGARLPTVRQLAGDIGLAVNTVARAYRVLESDGVITTHGRKGTFVTLQSTPTDAVTEAATRFATVARQTGLTLSEAIRAVEDAWQRP